MGSNDVRQVIGGEEAANGELGEKVGSAATFV